MTKFEFCAFGAVGFVAAPGIVEEEATIVVAIVLNVTDGSVVAANVVRTSYVDIVVAAWIDCASVFDEIRVVVVSGGTVEILRSPAELNEAIVTGEVVAMIKSVADVRKVVLEIKGLEVEEIAV